MCTRVLSLYHLLFELLSHLSLYTSLPLSNYKSNSNWELVHKVISSQTFFNAIERIVCEPNMKSGPNVCNICFNFFSSARAKSDRDWWLHTYTIDSTDSTVLSGNQDYQMCSIAMTLSSKYRIIPPFLEYRSIIIVIKARLLLFFAHFLVHFLFFT
jgi:hypothetical protein